MSAKIILRFRRVFFGFFLGVYEIFLNNEPKRTHSSQKSSVTRREKDKKGGKETQEIGNSKIITPSRTSFCEPKRFPNKKNTI